MGFLTPKYPSGAEPERKPSRKDRRAAEDAEARAEGWIVPERRRQSVLRMLLDGVEEH